MKNFYDRHSHNLLEIISKIVLGALQITILKYNIDFH